MSNDTMPPNNDTAQEIEPQIAPQVIRNNMSQPTAEINPQIARFPNPIPTTHEGYVAGLAPRDQICQEKISQEIAEVLDAPITDALPLPIFNR